MELIFQGEKQKIRHKKTHMKNYIIGGDQWEEEEEKAVQGRRPAWLELALARREVEGEARQVAGTEPGHSVGQ